MACKALCFGLICIIFAYYIYAPMPENIEEPWKVGLIDAAIKTTSFVCMLTEYMGLIRKDQVFATLVKVDYTSPVSDSNITVTDTIFSGSPVRLYLPKRKSDSRRPAVIYIHGGAFVLGSFKLKCYDYLNRWTANTLDAVVVAVDYRLSPEYQFPVPLEDVISAVKFFLQDEILAAYGVDPTRICISGDSSGGTLAATITHLVQNDAEFKNKFKAQALLYPVLQIVDLLLPSYQEHQHGPILPRKMGIEMGSLYISKDKALTQAMILNNHMPLESRHLLTLVNWSTLLPENYKKNHLYTEPVLSSNSSYPQLLNSSLSPLLASDSQLQNVPLTYVLTCEHDILRDDGLIYITRLRNLGLKVSHDHIEDGVHGALSFTRFPFYLRMGMKVKEKYIRWLKENL
ncbi:arylacetamide deacetylase-like 2 [Sorex araneus]|uniref:arylacetamide deacetylase-like 2 n=1 Tax=Sorex araneus TaxID=42254 RepID=UPI0024339724|nr:arylacetamide deacetylase-like 2 [Sorex araneus]